MEGSSFIPPPPPPPSHTPVCEQPTLGRRMSWHRTSLPNSASPPPPPPPDSWVPGSGYAVAEELRNSHPSLITNDPPSFPPSPTYGHMTPAMCEEMRKLVDAGGLEGLKRKIVEEVLKNGDADRSPPTASPTRMSSPTSSAPYSTSPTSYSHSFSPTPRRNPGWQRSFMSQSAAGYPEGIRAPYTPPDSPIDSSQSDGLSIVDRRWGELFDKNGNATPRLGQVLRGIAKYLISEVSPVESVVISPAKLANFYREYSVDNEPHCFSDIFKCRDDSKEEYRNIAELFEDLECDYHLIKATPTSRPIVPALTPAGFAKWTIMAIFAYPDVEAKRLDRIMSQLPIDADGPFVDGKPERLPKQLSRYLLPSKADKSARNNFKVFVDDFFQDRESRQKRAAEKARRNQSDGFSSKGGNQDNVAKKDYPDTGPRPGSPREEKKRPTKNVSFKRSQPKEGSSTEGGPVPPSSHPFAGRAGRPYNLTNITVPPPSGRSSQERASKPKPSRRAEASDFDSADGFSTSLSSSPSSSSPAGSDANRNWMEKNDRSYRYSQRAEDVTPRRMPGGGGTDDVPRSGKRRATTPSQDKPSGRDHGRRESATTGRDEYSY